MAVTKHNIDKPDEVRQLGKGKMSLVALPQGNVGRGEYPSGWKWSTDAKPMQKTDSCQLHHLGVVESGTIHVKMDDGSEDDLGPGDIFDVPSGHDAWVTSKESFVFYEFGAVAKP